MNVGRLAAQVAAGALIAAVAITAAQAPTTPIPCGVFDPCTTTAAPTTPVPPGGSFWDSATAVWLYSTFGAALLAFVVGLLRPVRSFLRHRIVESLRRVDPTWEPDAPEPPDKAPPPPPS